MARSIAIIKQQIIDAKNAETGLAGLNSSSQTAVWNLWAFITAVALNLHEQLWDIFKAEIEDIASKTAPGTSEWLRAKVFEFQYSESDPQEISLIDFVPRYPNINEDLQIIGNCSVTEIGNRVLVKVAKRESDDLVPLSTDELNALRTYVGKIKFAGTNIVVNSLEADRIQIIGDIFYNGQYSEAVIKERVLAAVKTYFENLSFDGVVYTSKIQDAIQAIAGITDVVIKNVMPRAAADPVKEYSETLPFVSKYTTLSGYIVTETEAGKTPEDTINFYAV